MRIESIDLHHIRMRLKAPFETSFGVEHDRDAVIVRVRAEGIEGWGECVAGAFPGYSYETVGTAWHVLEEFFVPAILGQDVKDVDDYRGRIAHFRGHPLARAGLELALWDLLGRARGESLVTLLGGERRAVPVGVSVGIQADAEVLLKVVEGYLAQGYRRVKLKIKPGRDLDEVRAVRAAHPKLALQVDANSAYTLEQRSVFQEMDALGLLLIEQPLADDDLLDHAALQAVLRTPICLDESILSLRHARQALDSQACRVINIKPARLGGLAEAVAVHDLCWGRGVPVWCGGMLETGIGRASNLALASLPGFTFPGDISASDRYYAEDIAAPPFTLNPDSTIDVPDAPGLGIAVDTNALARVTLRSAAFSA
jgi:o-succinylbenzoate synthase